MNISDLKGIGLTTEKYLNELGIITIEDLATYYPFKYEIIENTDLKTLKDGDKIIVGGIIENKPNVYHFNKKLNKMSFRLNTGDFIANITIFNRAFLKSKLDIGTVITVIGKYDQKHSQITANDIKFGLIEETIIEPIYHASFKINSSKISKIIKSSLNDFMVKETLPNYLKEKYKLMNKNKAIRIVHNPKTKKELTEALNTLKYEELFIYMLKIEYLKTLKTKENGLPRNVSYKQIEKFIESLPFKLTIDQLKAVNDIYDDLTGLNRMNRLLQGDVGSGKTIVAIISMYLNYLSGYQSALMSPTEILAIQHYNNIKKILPNLNIALLTGKLKAKEKKRNPKTNRRRSNRYCNWHSCINK